MTGDFRRRRWAFGNKPETQYGYRGKLPGQAANDEPCALRPEEPTVRDLTSGRNAGKCCLCNRQEEIVFTTHSPRSKCSEQTHCEHDGWDEPDYRLCAVRLTDK